MRASVAMAVYHGEEYIEQQVTSILCQLTSDDELIISYQDPQEKALDKIKTVIDHDPRVKVFFCPEQGHKKNFSNAVLHCSGAYVFYADQDDEWKQDKIEKVLRAFQQTGATMVVHNARYADENLTPLGSTIFETRKTKTGVVRNIIKGRYYGCCMAFSSALIPFVLPFPEKIPSHDMWTGLIANLVGKVVLLNDELVLYRRHGNNMSPDKHGSVFTMVSQRLTLVKNLTERYFQKRLYSGAKAINQ